MGVTRITVVDVTCDYCEQSAEWIGVRTVAHGVAQAQGAGLAHLEDRAAMGVSLPILRGRAWFRMTTTPDSARLVRPLRRGRHHLLTGGFVDGRWCGMTRCGRNVDRSTWQGEGDVKWSPLDACRSCFPGPVETS